MGGDIASGRASTGKHNVLSSIPDAKKSHKEWKIPRNFDTSARDLRVYIKRMLSDAVLEKFRGKL